ncbi:MAG: glycosyl hydrolase family 28 protein, partial [Bacteroidales bacterium]|nr:glycosyl hydrolase family 28 protein [Bacteroidales bacterium]
DQALSREMNYAGTPIEDRIFGEGHFLRPQLIQLFECKNVLIEDVLLKDSPFWCLHLLKSENITVRGIRFSAFNKNNDGIDPEYSRNVLIENVQFNNSDDNVAIKAGRDYEGRKTNTPSENIIIRNCSFKGLHAVVIGSEMSSGVRNVFVRDCDHGGYLKRGIYLKSNPDRGGYIKHVYIDNLKLGTVEDCFFITSNYQNQGKGFETEIRDIHVNNLHCEKAENAGIVIQGFATKKVSDIYLSKVNIEKAAVGLFMEHAENIVLDNVISGGRVGAPSTAKTGDIERIRQQ